MGQGGDAQSTITVSAPDSRSSRATPRKRALSERTLRWNNPRPSGQKSELCLCMKRRRSGDRVTILVIHTVLFRKSFDHGP
jgi:hypothetical protein